MPQAVTTTIVGLLLALASMSNAGGESASAAGPLAQARRLIEAKDYRSAMTILEDLLLEADATEKPAITALLKQTYQVLARQAQAAGRDRDAAHYLDNIAILTGTRPARIRSSRHDLYLRQPAHSRRALAILQRRAPRPCENLAVPGHRFPGRRPARRQRSCSSRPLSLSLQECPHPNQCERGHPRPSHPSRARRVWSGAGPWLFGTHPGTPDA